MNDASLHLVTNGGGGDRDTVTVQKLGSQQYVSPPEAI